jgi:hypothetical protein
MSQSSTSIDLAKMIDRKSFMLGMMTAFGECVAAEAKKCAFSPPFYPDDYFILKTEAERIADELNLGLWLEENEEIGQDHKIMWWVMYKFPETLDEYHALRAKGFNPAFEFDQFYDLLSYGYAFGDHAEKVNARIRRKGETMDTVARILFQPGDWPLPADSRTS